jgi:hypothetical protein
MKESWLIHAEGRKHSSADVLRLIGQLFRGKRAQPGGAAAPTKPRIKHRGDDEEDDEREETESKFAALEVFNEQMSDALTSAKGIGTDAILFVWLHVNLEMFARDPEQEDARLVPFAARWLSLVANQAQTADGGDTLTGPVFGVAAILGQFNSELSERHLQYQHVGLSLEKLHQCLESHVGRSVVESRAVSDAFAWLQYSAASHLVHHRPEEAVESLRLILSKPTYRSVLLSIVKARQNAKRIEFPREMFDARALALIDSILKAKTPLSNTRFVDRHHVTGCPHCHVSLLRDTLGKLQSSRIVKCDNCATILLALAP